MVIFNALTQMDEISGILWPLMDKLEDEVLIDLLLVRKQRRRPTLSEMSSQAKGSRVMHSGSSSSSSSSSSQTQPGAKGEEDKTQLRLYDYVPCPEGDKFSFMAFNSAMSREKLSPALLQLFSMLERTQIIKELHQTAYRFLTFGTWLMEHWPESSNRRYTCLQQNDLLYSLRQVSTLSRLHEDLKRVKVSIDDLDVYSQWVEYRNLGSDCIVQLGFAALSGCTRADDVVQQPLECLLLSATTTILNILHKLIETGPATSS